MFHVSKRILAMSLLLTALAQCGSRKSDGTVNASGKVYLYRAGTIQQEQGYSDERCTTPISTTAGAIALDAAGKRTIYMKAPADVVVTTADGSPVDASIGGFNRHRAELCEVQNASYTGSIYNADGTISQGLGGFTDLNTVLTNAATSLGPNFQRKRIASATAMNFSAWADGIAVFAVEFGALFDNLVDDTAAIQAAINEASRLGGARVMLPPGTGRIATAGTGLTVPAGVTLVGAGSEITTIRNMHGTATAITATGNGLAFEGFTIDANSSSTGAALSVSSCTGLRISDVSMSLHATGLALSTVDKITVDGGGRWLMSSAAGGRAMTAASVARLVILGGSYSGGTYDFEFTGTNTAGITILGTHFVGTGTGIRFASSAVDGTESGFFIAGCLESGTTLLSFEGATMPHNLYQQGNGINSSATSTATGAAATPSLIKGHTVKLTATGGAGTVTVNAPAVLPAATQEDVYYDFVFINAAGGAVTWTLNAVFVVNAAIPTTDAHTIGVRFRWDGSKLREVSRADTVT
jgi:hypothetical protein